MRAALLSALLLVLLALAGCSGEKEVADGDGTDGADDGDRVSDPGSQPADNATDPPHTDVQLLSEPFEAVGQGSMTYDVTVPDEVTNVDFTLVSSAPATERVSLTVSLSGCGSYSDGTISGQAGGAGVVAGGRLCADAAGGAQQVTIELQGVVPGATITVTGQVPK